MLTQKEQTELAALQNKASLTSAEQNKLDKLVAKMAETAESEKIDKTAAEIAALSIEDRTEYFKSKGYKAERLDIAAYQSSSNLPAKGTIIDVKEVVYEITNNATKETTKQNGLRIIAKDENNKLFDASLTRCALRAIVKTEAKKELDLSELNFDRNNHVRIVGENLSDIPNHPVLIYDFLGKSFTAEKVTVFALPFGKSFDNKHEALENVTIQTGFAVKIV